MALLPPFRHTLAVLRCLAILAWGLTIPVLAHAGDWPGHNFPGGDYRHFTTSPGPGAWGECRAACEGEAQCRAFTLVDAGVQEANPVCWLKNGDFNIVADSRMDSWLKDLYYAAIRDENRQGMDYRSVEFHDPSQGAMECRRMCQDDSQCLAFTYVDPGIQAAGGMCWLKNGAPEPSYAAGCHSGLIYERVDASSFTTVTGVVDLGILHPAQDVMENVNLPGMDYFNFNVSVDDPDLCREACERDGNCRAYTYVRPGVQGEFGRCWLKNDVPEQVTDYNAVSGILR